MVPSTMNCGNMLISNNIIPKLGQVGVKWLPSGCARWMDVREVILTFSQLLGVSLLTTPELDSRVARVVYVHTEEPLSDNYYLPFS